VQHSTARWKGDVQFIVFMQANASAQQIDAVRQSLSPTTNPQVKRVTYFDKKQAYAEFKDIFRDEPVLQQSLTEADMPTSFRVSPRVANPDLISQMVAQQERLPGVYRVTFGYDTVKKFERLSSVVSTVILLTALFLLLAAGLLILNTIRMAMFGSASSGTASSTNILQGLYVSSGEVFAISVGLLIVGCLVGVVGSGIAVTRFLDV